jgi:GrpB-like predicted nucleotidyltransferase (UPF0157 family)
MTRQPGPVDVDLDEPIELTTPRSEWPALFSAELTALHGALAQIALAIEHIGSTAVPGLVAKPVIDIQVGVVGPPELAKIYAPLVGLGYESLGQAGVPGRLYFRRRGAHAFNVHVVAFGGLHWTANLAVRDYLRKHPDETARYAAAKQTAVASGATSLLDYSEHKSAYLTALVERALAWSSGATEAKHAGSCLCGAVRFEVRGELPPPDACHCTKCRKSSGHYFASTDVKRANVTIHGDQAIKWYQSSEKVRRGFCSTCGSPLFFDPPADRDWIGIAMGAFESPTHTKLKHHIFVANKGDYYEIADGLPQNEQ